MERMLDEEIAELEALIATACRKTVELRRVGVLRLAELAKKLLEVGRLCLKSGV